jgi:putative membrane protein
MLKTILAGTVVIGFAAGAAAQQATPTPTSPASAGQSDRASKSTLKANEAPDHTFVVKAAEGGLAEVDLGQLAADKASSEDVKKFGQRMVTDHSKANDELKALAQQKNITLPTEVDAKDKATHDRLAKMSGAAFDKAYMQHMVADHKTDVNEFKKESASGKDPDVKAWAGKTLPTLEEHLKLAQDANKAVGTSGTKSDDTKKGTKGSR